MNYFSKNFLGIVVLVGIVLAIGIFVHELAPANAQGNVEVFEVKQGDGLRMVADNLHSAGLIHSPLAFDVFATLDGSAFGIQPGLYKLSSSMSSAAILNALTDASSGVTVTIPEGSDIYDIDRILSDALVVRRGDFVAAATTASSSLEGKLFPDTYNFFSDADVNDIIQKMTDDFNAKAEPFLANDPQASRDLIVASLVQKEVASSTDQAIVAGIIDKRLAAGMPLDIDATICYIKQQEMPTSIAGCYPLSQSDFAIDSPFNTYLYKGLPPTPIGNPGVAAIEAALHPKSSPYFYYLSDPKTGETIYAVTLEQQNANRAKYLGN